MLIQLLREQEKTLLLVFVCSVEHEQNQDSPQHLTSCFKKRCTENRCFRRTLLSSVQLCEKIAGLNPRRSEV